MKTQAHAAVLFATFFSVAAFAQQLPTSEGTCSVSPSGVEGCQWMSKLPPRGRQTMVATTYVLAVGAPLASVAGEDSVLVAITDGDFNNEISFPPSKFWLAAGHALLVQDQRYKIRNAGKKPATLLAIQLRPSSTSTAFTRRSASVQIDLRDSCEQVGEVLPLVNEIHAGDARAKVELNFEEDGGMPFPLQTTYVWKDCKYVKIEVEWSHSAKNKTWLPTDKVVKVSKPYLELPAKG